MEKGAFKEELGYLNIVKPQLELNIQYYENELKEIPKRYTNVEQGDQFLVENLMSAASTRLRLLELSKSTPYFARIDFVDEENKKKSKLYIGKTTINSNDNKNLTIDWRAPICSLYYDSDVGEVSYVAPVGTIKGKLELKRQIIIKNGKLSDVLDTNLVTNDELLQPYLSVNADNKMKTIIASIQKEQNQIIRESIDKNIIVQGVAGSGKTSVALHRIAYLIYALGEKVKSNQFLVIGPNRYFLNYISSILPELETDPVEQETYLDIVNLILKEKLLLDNQTNIFDKIEKTKYYEYQAFKSSLKYKRALDKFINEYINSEIVCDSFIIDNEEIYHKKKIRTLLFNNRNEKLNFNNACNILVSDFKNNINEIYSKINEKYRKVYISLPPEDIARQESIKKSEELERLIKEKGIKLIKDYFKKFQVNTFDLYKLFMENIEKYVSNFESKDLMIFKEYSLSLLKRKKVLFEDLPALLHINTIVFGNVIDYKHIVIDEAQDYGLFHFDAIKEAFPNSTFSIYGDLAQAIYSYRSINNWEDVVNSVFNQNCQTMYLSKSYRTTVQITNNSNHILRKMCLNEAIPVIRNGRKVEFLNYANNLNYKINIINELKEKGNKTIAFICKTDIESDKLYKQLLKNNVDVTQINTNANEYNGGTVVLTSSLSKGLEFDAVIINDASEEVYTSNSLSDLHLLYVASTRSLHELIMLYSTTLCKAFPIIKQIN